MENGVVLLFCRIEYFQVAGFTGTHQFVLPQAQHPQGTHVLEDSLQVEYDIFSSFRCISRIFDAQTRANKNLSPPSLRVENPRCSHGESSGNQHLRFADFASVVDEVGFAIVEVYVLFHVWVPVGNGNRSEVANNTLARSCTAMAVERQDISVGANCASWNLFSKNLGRFWIPVRA